MRNIEDETTGDAFVKFRIKKTCNRMGYVIVQREYADDAAALLSIFKRKNADFPINSDKALSVIKTAIKQPPLNYDPPIPKITKSFAAFADSRRQMRSRR